MDEADRAQEHIERERAWAISRRRPTLMPIGRCWFCSEPGEGLFCDRDCRDDYEREQAAIDRAGRRDVP